MRKKINEVAAIIFEEMAAGASYHYILGMITLARKIGAINKDEEKGLLQYLEERG